MKHGDLSFAGQTRARSALWGLLYRILAIVLALSAGGGPTLHALPPEMEADKLLLEAQELMNNQKFDSACHRFSKIERLKLKSLPTEFYFYYGKAEIKTVSRPGSGIKHLEKYVTQTGKQGKYYKEALELISAGEAQIKRYQRDTKGTFTACGKEWNVGGTWVNWDEAQSWIKGLGDGWRTPTMAELKALFAEKKDTSPIGTDWVWSEARDSSSAWDLNFSDGSEDWFHRDDRSEYRRVVAVRSRR